MSNISSILITFHWFFIWIAPSDVDLTFLTHVDRGTTLALWLYHQHNPYMWHMAWEWCHFLLAPDTRKVWQGTVYDKSCKKKTVMYSVCQIVLHHELLRKFEKWCKFSSQINTKYTKEITQNKTCLYRLRREFP